MHLKGQRARHNSLTEESAENLNFVVMLKKGNKQQFKGNQINIDLNAVSLPRWKLKYTIQKCRKENICSKRSIVKP